MITNAPKGIAAQNRQLATAIAAPRVDLDDATITDDQIRELRRSAQSEITDATKRESALEALLCSYNALSGNLDVSDADGTWRYWRGRCATILNARTGGSRG